METKKVSSQLEKYENILRPIYSLIILVGLIMNSFLAANLIFNSKGFVKSLAYNFSFPGLEIMITNNNIDGPIFALTIFTISMNILYWSIAIYFFYQFRKILRLTIEKGTPFIYDNIKRLKYIGYSFFIFAILQFGIWCILSQWLSKLKLVGPTNIDMRSKISIPIWPLIVGVIILCIAQFFSYGFKLQQDNDSIV